MMDKQDWQWDEMQQVGTDYTDLKEVEAYDERMADFRNVDDENRQILSALNLPTGAVVLEIGCGTGQFTRAAARAGHCVTAIDISPIMLEFLEKKASTEGLSNIKTKNAGFLTMDVPESHFDAIVSCVALHHLPDAWKLVALRNVARALKPGGQFILRDVIFSLGEGSSPEDYFESLASGLPTMRAEAVRHIAQEFSTYDWIIDGLLTRVGFTILSKENMNEHFVAYHCRK